MEREKEKREDHLVDLVLVVFHASQTELFCETFNTLPRIKSRAEQAALPTRGKHRPRGIVRLTKVSGCSPRAAGL